MHTHKASEHLLIQWHMHPFSMANDGKCLLHGLILLKGAGSLFVSHLSSLASKVIFFKIILKNIKSSIVHGTLATTRDINVVS